ncbi:hypothetical protein NUW54_g9341 [Trametes sanguinea]|uniref:Uncharacterized protein n=1 Tax=Trametes sanguinea TaxID=158606 RepID=A0ACC1P6Q4_9APHY|nr:hypothetical protein NUW54_g9341 [Trametes sanguinea]
MVRIVYDKIVNFCGMNSIPCVVVGSKIDLQNRQVDGDEGERLARDLGAAFVETSAKNNVNVCQYSLSPDPAPRAASVRPTTDPFLRPTAKVFELCLAEIEKRQPNNKQEPQASKCLIM